MSARIVYAALATPLAAAAGFYLAVIIFTRVLPGLRGLPAVELGWNQFAISLVIAGVLAFSVFWWMLTLPGTRLRSRRLRGWRIAASAILVLLVSAAVQAEGLPLRYTFALTIWMALVLTLTLIPYGLLGGVRRRSTLSSRYLSSSTPQESAPD